MRQYSEFDAFLGPARIGAWLNQHYPNNSPFIVRRHPSCGGRNRVWLATTRTRPGRLIVKQPADALEGDRSPREFWAFEGPLFHCDAIVTPTLLDRTVGLIAMDEGGAIEEGPARCKALADLGTTLAALHSIEPDALASGPQVRQVPQLAPMTDLSVWKQCGHGGRAVIRLCQKDRAITRAFEATLANATSKDISTLVHGDVRAENVIFINGRPALVDFDDCGVGPAARDLGAAMGAIVCHWVDGLRMLAGHSPLQWVADGEICFSEVVQSVARLLRTYRETLSKRVPPPSLSIVVDWAVVWIANRTWYDAVGSASLPASLRARLLAAAQLPESARELW
jgi:hypothetical protein